MVYFLLSFAFFHFEWIFSYYFLLFCFAFFVACFIFPLPSLYLLKTDENITDSDYTDYGQYGEGDYHEFYDGGRYDDDFPDPEDVPDDDYPDYPILVCTAY